MRPDCEAEPRSRELAGLRPNKDPPRSDGQRMQPDCEAEPRSRELASRETRFTMRSWHSRLDSQPGSARSKSSQVRRTPSKSADPTSRQTTLSEAAINLQVDARGLAERPHRIDGTNKGARDHCGRPRAARGSCTVRQPVGSRPRTAASPTRDGRDRPCFRRGAAGRPWWSRRGSPQPNATIILTSILRRGGAPGGEVGSSNDVCGHTAARRPRVSSCLMKSTSPVVMRET